jgi:streptogramin lyase
MPEPTHEEIAGYRIESEISRGGMGVVYRARQTFPDRPVALKLLSPELAADPGFRERFVRESNAAASTEHPNIVPIYGAGEVDGRLYLAMRLVDGVDLGLTIRREGRLGPERAVAVCAQVAAALDAAHARGLVHRDVKPGNVLIDGSGHAYLTDFGLITRNEIETGITRTGQFMGSTAYCAPEQIKGEPVDARTDVYSLGGVLYECLTGEPPFPRASEAATLYAHLEEPPPKPSEKVADVPLELDAVVVRAMAKSPEDRFTSAGELAAAARAALVASAAAPVEAPRRALPFPIVAGVGLVVLAIAIFAVVQLQGGGSAGPGPNRSAAPGEILSRGLLAFDPTTHQISTRVPLPFPDLGAYNPIPTVAAGEGGIWTIVNGDLWRIDPSSGEARKVEVPACQVSGAKSATLAIVSIDVGPGAVWALCRWDPVLVVRIDPFTHAEKTIRTSVTAGGPLAAGQLVTTASDVWVAPGDGSIRRFDAARAQELGRIGVGGDGVWAGAGDMWVSDALSSTLTPINARTGRSGTPVTVSGNLDDVAVGEGAVWVLDRSGGTVTLVDPSAGTAGPAIGIGAGGTSIGVGFGAVWVTDPEDHSLIRIDPVTRQSERFDVRAQVVDLAPDAQSGKLWLSVVQGRVQ